MIDAAIYKLLTEAPGLVALVGARIRPQGAPEVQGSAYPHLTYRKVSDINISRSNLGRGNMWRARIQIDAWALKPLQAAELADEVLVVLDPTRQPDQPKTDLLVMADCTVHNGEVVQRVPYDEPTVPLPQNPSSHAQRVQTDFHFEYSRT